MKKNKFYKLIAIIVLASHISLPFTPHALEFRIDCIDIMKKNSGIDDWMEWYGDEDTKRILLEPGNFDSICVDISITEQKVKMMCPILSPSEDNPKGLSSLIIKSQNNLHNDKADLIALGNIIGECTMKIN